MMTSYLSAFIMLFTFVACQSQNGQYGKTIMPNFVITQQNLGTNSSLRGLDVYSKDVIWTSGSGGVFGVTTDGGALWAYDTLTSTTFEYRDVEVLSPDTALLLKIASPGQIYKTVDGGLNWQLVFEDTREDIFLDAFSFWDSNNGIAFGDPIAGKHVILRTNDGGENWLQLDTASLPQALENEGGFAASGTCVATVGDENVWLAFGGKQARVFRSKDRGDNWVISSTPLASDSAAAGIFSISFLNDKTGVIVGGDYMQPTNTEKTAAWTQDGGATWQLAETMPGGYRSCVDWVKWHDQIIWVAVGPSGSDYSMDNGHSWHPINEMGFHSISFTDKHPLGWSSGDKGTLAKWIINDQLNSEK